MEPETVDNIEQEEQEPLMNEEQEKDLIKMLESYVLMDFYTLDNTHVTLNLSELLSDVEDTIELLKKKLYYSNYTEEYEETIIPNLFQLIFKGKKPFKVTRRKFKKDYYENEMYELLDVGSTSIRKLYKNFTNSYNEILVTVKFLEFIKEFSELDTLYMSGKGNLIANTELGSRTVHFNYHESINHKRSTLNFFEKDKITNKEVLVYSVKAEFETLHQFTSNKNFDAPNIFFKITYIKEDIDEKAVIDSVAELMSLVSDAKKALDKNKINLMNYATGVI